MADKVKNAATYKEGSLSGKKYSSTKDGLLLVGLLNMEEPVGPILKNLFSTMSALVWAYHSKSVWFKDGGAGDLYFGSDQKEAPRILSSEDWWCQGYSEPWAGSDLAALNHKAVRDGDDGVVNGAKIWTTNAQLADWIFP